MTGIDSSQNQDDKIIIDVVQTIAIMIFLLSMPGLPFEASIQKSSTDRNIQKMSDMDIMVVGSQIVLMNL